MAGFTMTLDDSPRGVCSVCGAPSYAPQAKKCQEHRTSAKKTPQRTNSTLDDAIAADRAAAGPSAAPSPDAPRPGLGQAVGSAPATSDDKSARAVHYARQIETELNPALVQGFAMLCKPVHPGNFYEVQGERIVPVRMGETVALSGLESWVLSHAAAELESSPMVKTVSTVAAPVLPIALAIGGAVLLGAKVYGLFHLREQVMEKYRLETAAAAPGAEQHEASAEAARAAQAAENERRAQSVQGQEEAQTQRRTEQVITETEGRPANSTRAEPLTDIDLGKPDAPAYDTGDLPDVAAAIDGEISDLLAVSN